MTKKTRLNRPAQLSRREMQVLQQVAEGATSKKIAELLGIKPSSVDTYRSRIMAKLNVDSVANLVRYAIRHRIIKP